MLLSRTNFNEEPVCLSEDKQTEIRMLASGFAALLAESLWLSGRRTHSLRLCLRGGVAARIFTQFRKARGFPQGLRQSRRRSISKQTKRCVGGFANPLERSFLSALGGFANPLERSFLSALGGCAALLAESLWLSVVGPVSSRLCLGGVAAEFLSETTSERRSLSARNAAKPPTFESQRLSARTAAKPTPLRLYWLRPKWFSVMA